MQSLKARILSEGQVFPGQILKVDSFLNHQIDVAFTLEMGREFHRLFFDKPITRVITLEASGIPVAFATAAAFGVPLVFAKKAKSANIDDSFLKSHVHSYTYQKGYDIIASKRYLEAGDGVLIIDDFLANGQALLGLIDLVEQAGATVCGCGVVIEKGFQMGGQALRAKGYTVQALATIQAFEGDGVILAE